MTKFEKFSAFLVILLLVLFGYFFYQNIYLPSKMSVDFVCNNNYTSEELENHPNVLGYYNSSSDEIYIKENYTINGTTYLIDNTSIQRTIRHEKIHYIQSLNNRLYNCNNKFYFTLNEIEANLMSIFNDKFLNFIYHTNNFF
jgi:hypothetical protein